MKVNRFTIVLSLLVLALALLCGRSIWRSKTSKPPTLEFLEVRVDAAGDEVAVYRLSNPSYTSYTYRGIAPGKPHYFYPQFAPLESYMGSNYPDDVLHYEELRPRSSFEFEVQHPHGHVILIMYLDAGKPAEVANPTGIRARIREFSEEYLNAPSSILKLQWGDESELLPRTGATPMQ